MLCCLEQKKKNIKKETYNYFVTTAEVTNYIYVNISTPILNL